jgi:uroporphyrinogen III methyltransferase/synthase
MTVYLVGAGPGDPGLLTVRGAEVLRIADVVVHDRLAEPALLDLAPAHAVRIDVGKVPGGPVDQDAINQLLIDHARTGARVVRLKGGDPFVFGRGGEEAAALLDAGVDFEVVPGVTAAVAVPAYAGVPVTHRGLATSFTVVTGHSRHQVDTETDWNALARAGRAGGTIVVLMGVAHRAEIAARLMAGGLDPATPVAAVTWGTRPHQRSLRIMLGALGAAPLEPPATIVIGAVAGLDLGWFERRPLFGRTVVVTRARPQAAALVRRLQVAGAATVEVPAIAFEPPADGGRALASAAGGLRAGEYQWVVFTSANAVASFMPLLPDSRSFGGASVAAIGPGTAAALAGWHVAADLVPPEFVAESLLATFPRPGPGGGRILLPRAEVARPVLPDGLREAGWAVDVVPAYRAVPAPVPQAVLDAARAADAITFASSGTVTAYLESAGRDAVPPFVVCIGPVTAATARAAGLRVDAEATEHTLDGLVDVLVKGLGGPVMPPARSPGRR